MDRVDLQKCACLLHTSDLIALLQLVPARSPVSIVIHTEARSSKSYARQGIGTRFAREPDPQDPQATVVNYKGPARPKLGYSPALDRSIF
jgi:hypothetical protein